MEEISLQRRGGFCGANGRPEPPGNAFGSGSPSVRQRPWIAAVALAALFLLPVPPSPAAIAREDSASLRLKVTAGTPKTRIHTVKEGEWIHDILRKQYGDEPVPYALIRKLNPRIRDLNRIYPGQKIRLPVPGRTASAPSGIQTGEESVSPSAGYQIRNGDSMTRILLEELGIRPEEALGVYRVVRTLNPQIDNMAQLPAGQRLKLPPGLSPASPPAAAPFRDATRTVERDGDGKIPAISPAALEIPLGILPAVIGRMKGAVTTKGNYFIPLAENSQVTVDCSLIPVVELDDGTTVLLDFGNRLAEPMKGLIRKSWPNYAFLNADELRDDLSALQRIVNHSRRYRMARSESALPLLSRPEVQVFPDWSIGAQPTAGAPPYRQGIFLLREGESPFPPEIRSFLEKNGLAVTEITKNQALAAPSSPPQTAQTVTDLSGFRGIAFVEELLSLLGLQAVRGAEISVFDQARHGFSLSVTADLLLRRSGKQVAFLTKRLPDQFVAILKDAGTEVIAVREKDRDRPLIEGVLRGLGLPASFGYFPFRVPDDASGRPRLSATLPALRTESEGRLLYWIDFDLPPGADFLFRDLRGGRLIRY